MTRRQLAALLFVFFALTLCSHRLARADIGSVEEMAKIFESQWDGVEALRVEYSKLFRSKTTNDNYDGCLWEVVGERARITESRQSYLMPLPTKEDEKKEKEGKVEPPSLDELKKIEVHSDSYYDGTKTYELVEPLSSYPLETVQLEDYYRLRRSGVRANISNSYKHWRFWSQCPLPRYFSVPTEQELLPLTELVVKYKSRLVNRIKNERAEEIVQLEVKDENPSSFASASFRNWRLVSWTLYLSFNLTKGGALSGYQLTIVMTPIKKEDSRSEDVKTISEYHVLDYQQAANGIWFPSNVEMRVHSPLGGSSLVKTRIRSVSINLPSPRFDEFHFPANLVVTEDAARGEGAGAQATRLVHIWGEEDAPAQTFDSEEAFMSFYESKYGPDTTGEEGLDGSPTLGRRGRLLIFVAVGFIAIVVMFGAALHYAREAEAEDE